MKEKKKKNYKLYVFMWGIGAFFSYLLSAAWTEGSTIFDLLEKIEPIMANPFGKLYWNEYTVRFIFIFTIIYAFFLIYEFTKPDLMPGKEHGTGAWGNVERINKKFMDKKHPENNRIYSNSVRVSINGKKTKINNNVFIIGGSGAGKSFYEVKPNVWNMSSSIVCTDPKGELLRDCGEYLKRNGYVIKVLNVNPGSMEQSDCYNPFKYIRSESDIISLITNLIANTTPADAMKGDPFWEKAESLFLKSLFLYVWMEEPPERKNFNSVLELLAKAEVSDDEPSELDIIMDDLAASSELGENHPAVRDYNKCVRGAGDTVRSIIISANSRMAFFENEQVKRILSRDELELATIGIGKNADGKTKTALFCIISDSDKSFNFIPGMLYTQLFQELYYQADFNYGGELPIPVTFWLDEFANVALPENFLSLLSTMRSRLISAVIIIQNMAQIKGMYKDGKHETIPGNCDTTIYLGGNEASTHEYISKALGDATIYKKSNSESKGRNASTSFNTDVLGRKIMFENEVRELDNEKCIVFIRGQKPIIDYKYKTLESPLFKNAMAAGKYKHDNGLVYDIKGNLIEVKARKEIELLSKKSFEYYKNEAEKGNDVKIYDFDYRELVNIYMKESYPDVPEKQIDITVYPDEEYDYKNITIDALDLNVKGGLEAVLLKNEVSDELLEAVMDWINRGLSDKQVLMLLEMYKGRTVEYDTLEKQIEMLCDLNKRTQVS